jgi:YVTN family beta-propeller protein
VIDGATDTVIGSPIAVGSNPLGVGVNPTTNKVYVTNQGGNTVSVIDGATDTVIGSPTVGANPYAVGVNPTTNKIYVANNSPNTVSVVNGATDAVIGSPIAVGTGPSGVGVNPTTNKIYVANYSGNTVSVIMDPPSVGVGTNPQGVGVNPTTNKIYVANGTGSNTVSVINGTTDTVIGSPIAVGTNPYGVGVNHTANKVYVANYGSNTVSVINGATDTVITGPGYPIAVGSTPEGVGVNPTTNKIYVANTGSNTVSVINGVTDAIIGSPIGVGANPNAIGVNPTTNKIYVTNGTSSTVSVIDGATDTLITGPGYPITVGTNPYAIGVNPTTNKVYVSNYTDGTVSVIDGATDTITGSPIAVGTNPFGVGVNPTTNKVYVANYGSDTVSVIDGATDTIIGSPIAVGTTPEGVGSNPTTDKMYVANAGSGTVSVLYDPSAPTTTVLSPDHKTAGEAGFALTVNGTGFISDSVVRWKGADRTTTYVSVTQVTATIPATDIPTAGTALVTVFTPGAGTSNAQTFDIDAPAPPTLATNAAASITTSGATLNGDITATGGANATQRGFQYRKTGTSTWANWTQTGSFGTGTFNHPLTGLSSGTGYEYQAMAHNSAGWAYGATRTFTTVAEGQSTWYLAEGTTAWGFSTYISIQNPNTSAVQAEITYMTGSGNVSGGTITLPAMSQTTVNPADKLGKKDFSTKVVCTEGKAIAVDRTMSWTGPGAASPEGHTSVGVTAPEKTWYLPEGASAWGFETWLLIQNPNKTAANCQVTYMIEGEAPKTVPHSVPPNSRQSFNMETDIGQKNASIKVDSNIPVIPERAMYRNNKREGHDSIGTTTAASDYYMAEGTTAWGFTTWVLIQNPASSPSTVTITYMTPTGKKVQPSFSLAGDSRKTIKVNDVAGMANTDFSTQVHGSSPIIAERSMYWDNGTGEACHDSIGMDAAHTTFYLPDGQTSEGRETWTLVQNPNSSTVNVEVSYLKAGGGAASLTASIPANSRMTFNMADKVTSGRASIMVTAKNGKKIMVERAMYWNSKGAGTDTIGGFSD